jgi:homoserine dehydrogenase
MNFNVALLGFGSVGRALAELLMAKQEALRADHHLTVRVVGISTGSHGHAIDPSGINLRTAIDAIRFGSRLDGLHDGRLIENTWEFLEKCTPDLVFESIPTNPLNGQPALDYIRSTLERGIHVVTANKGPVAFGYHELDKLALNKDVGFFFESTVMDGAPVISIGREGLLAAKITKIRGILNSSTNYILTRMEQDGLSFDSALGEASKSGFMETDSALDIDGWDSAVKTVILANVLMGANLCPTDVAREGIRGITLEDIQNASAEGQRIKLICEATLLENNNVTAYVSPQKLSLADPLAGVMGTSSVVDYHMDILPRLTVIENDPSPSTTAYGMLVDMINIARGRHWIGRNASP